MRLFEDSDETIRVRWYFCAPDAGVYPGYHRYASANWDSGPGGTNPVGEIVGTPRPYYNGRRHAGFHGRKFCGDPAKIENGFKYADKRLCTNNDGLSSCCTIPRQWWCCDFQDPAEPITFTITKINNKYPLTVLNEGDTITLDPLGDTEDFGWGTEPNHALAPSYPIGQPWRISVACSFFRWQILVQQADQISPPPQEWALAIEQPDPFGIYFPSFFPFTSLASAYPGIEKEEWVGVIGTMPSDAFIAQNLGMVPEDMYPDGMWPDPWL